jgi:hypothetical protein
MLRLLFPSLTVALLLASVPLPVRAEPAAKPEPSEDEKLLQAAKVATEGPGLLEFFRKRTPSDKDRERVAGLIRLLGEESFPARQKAADDLVAVGPTALPQLRRALGDRDEEVRQRARECIEAIDPNPRGALAAAAARRVHATRPAGAVPVLLAYLPSADGQDVEEEILNALVVLGVRDGKVDADLAAALPDKAPERRAAAALVLGRSGTAEQRDKARSLLSDAEPRVRFRAAQGLVAGHDKTAVPALIALVADGPLDVAQRADDLLACLLPPSVYSFRAPVGDTDLVRRSCRNGWEIAWKSYGKTLDLAHADVDLLPFNPALQARTATRQFLGTMRRGDVLGMEKATDVPFVMIGNNQTFTTREELNQFCAGFAANGNNAPMSASIGTTVGPSTASEEYGKRLPPDQKTALAPVLKAETRVVKVSAVFNGQVQKLVVFVRTGGERGFVVGYGPDQARPILTK